MTYANIIEVLNSIGLKPSHRNKDWIQLPCPFAGRDHPNGSDRKPSFGIHINDKGESGFHCFSCKSKGPRLSSLVRKVAHLRNEDYDKLAMKADSLEVCVESVPFDYSPISSDEPLDPSIFEGLYDPIKDSKEAKKYLKDRGVSLDAAKTMDLVFDPDQRRILFPVKGSRGEVYGFSGRGVSSEVFPKVRDYNGLNKSNHLLGHENLTKSKPVLLVEGLFAYARMVELGVHFFVEPVASLGSSLSDEQAEILKANEQPVYILYDNDEAGDIGIYGKFRKGTKIKEAKGAIDKLSEEVTVYIPDPWPDGKDDPDDLTLEELEVMIDNSILC
jgi:DNA primase